MTSHSRRSLTLRVVGATAAGALALAAVPAAAHAEDPGSLHVTYDASGSSYVKKIGTTVPLGPTTLSTVVAPDGTFTGLLPLPSKRVTFKLVGLLPVTATVNFIPVSATSNVTGKVTTVVTSKASYILRLSDVTVGVLPAFVGNSCQTKDVVVIPANTPAGKKFNITTGGTVTGTYTIGQFANCGLTTSLVNQLVPGPDNTQTLTLSNGRLS